MVLDVDGVVSPVNGRTAWGDDTYVGEVFGPVVVSPLLCDQLEELDAHPHVQCWWLTSWTSRMRAGLDPFPGRLWPVVADPEDWSIYEANTLTFGDGPWWKWEAINCFLHRTSLDGLVWCDDHLRQQDDTMNLRDVVKAELDRRGLASLLVCPPSEVGLSPADMEEITDWVTNLSRATPSG